MVKRYLKRGLGVIGAGITIGAMPNISGTTAETTMKTDTMHGLTNISKTFPMQGSLIGTGMVLKQIKRIRGRKRR